MKGIATKKKKEKRRINLIYNVWKKMKDKTKEKTKKLKK